MSKTLTFYFDNFGKVTLQEGEDYALFSVANGYDIESAVDAAKDGRVAINMDHVCYVRAHEGRDEDD